MIKAARNSKPAVRIASSDSARLGSGITIAQLLRRKPITIPIGSSIERALKVMAENKIGSVVIVSAEALLPVGIVTLQDVLLRIALPRTDIAQPVASVMTTNPICVESSLSAHNAALRMTREKLRHLLVTNSDGVLIGIISRNDIYDLLCNSCISIRNTRRLVAPGR